MFKYDRNRDRFIPDRYQDQYHFAFMHDNLLGHQYVCSLDHSGLESDFLEPFECQRRQEIQHQALRQIQRYMSLELKGANLLPSTWNDTPDQVVLARHYRPDAGEWPVRMVRQRSLARKSNHRKTMVADMLLDMPNLTTDWMTKILDWSSTGYLTAAIESSIHLWSSRTQSVQCTINVTHVDAEETIRPLQANDSTKTMIVSLKWDARGEKLAYSYTVERTQQPQNVSPFVRTSTSTVEQDVLDQQHFGEISTSTVRYGSLSSDDDTTQTIGTNFKNYIKVWHLNGLDNDKQNTSICSCSNDQAKQCCIFVMDWMANCRILVVGCTRSMVTFFKYDSRRRQLIPLRITCAGDPVDKPKLISLLNLSKDEISRYVAVATLSLRSCTLKVWRIEYLPEDSRQRHNNNCQIDSDVNVNVTITFRDRYGTKVPHDFRRVIKAFAWHPWKHSLMCYAVTSVSENISPVMNPSWYVLANASTGQVVKRVNQSSMYVSCPSVTMLSVDTHSMTFSRLTGELLVSATRQYRVRRNSGSSIEEKHSIVVMHALNRIVEMLSSSCTERGIFFAWSPDGLRIAMTSSDESLRIWNFWPTVQRKDPITSTRFLENSVQPTDVGELNTSSFPETKHNNNYYFQCNYSYVSELSLDASRVIK